MESFFGQSENSLDEKSRLSIPSKFRKALTQMGQTEFVLSMEQTSYLKLYPYHTWKQHVGDQVKKLPHGDGPANNIRRRIGLCMNEGNMDNQGRIVIPPYYCKHAGIDKKIRIVGSVDVLQLWHPPTHDRLGHVNEEATIVEELYKLMRKYGIPRTENSTPESAG